ncbi:MAG TPA: hypothetical protein VHH35_02240 [Pyrinomonadaceae bacterium]|nr:hypothetical protein [Pyrinomonadaceae bacterium]
MAKKGRYCKAYPISRFREYKNWSENTQNLRKEVREIDGQKVEVQRELSDSDFFYLQEDLVVTDDIFIDENIVFADVTPEWIEFCKNTLKFEVPVYETAAATS